MANRVIVFVRRKGALGIGHVGWAFAEDEAMFHVGSVENPWGLPITPSADKGFWVLRTPDPVAPMRARHYDEFKVLDLPEANPTYAKQVVAWVHQQSYEIIGRNCMDAAYDILRAYGCSQLPVPAHDWEPNHWFDHLSGNHYHIDRDGVDQAEGQQLKLHGPILSDLASLTPTPPPETTPAAPAWRVPGTDEADHFAAALKAAPPMPVSHQNLLRRLLRLLGITRQ